MQQGKSHQRLCTVSVTELVGPNNLEMGYLKEKGQNQDQFKSNAMGSTKMSLSIWLKGR